MILFDKYISILTISARYVVQSVIHNLMSRDEQKYYKFVKVFYIGQYSLVIFLPDDGSVHESKHAAR